MRKKKDVKGANNVNCKGCGATDCQVISEEVDIGVGAQVHILGYECPVCGPHTICDTCGTWDTEPCPAWCQEIKAGREFMEEL